MFLDALDRTLLVAVFAGVAFIATMREPLVVINVPPDEFAEDEGMQETCECSCVFEPALVTAKPMAPVVIRKLW